MVLSMLQVEPLPQSDRVVAGFVARGEEEGDGLTAQPIEQTLDCRLRRRLAEFGIIGGLEFFPTRRIAVKAAAQGVAGGNLLQPKVDPRLFPRQAAGPKAVHQDADAVIVVGRVVDAFDARLMSSHLGPTAITNFEQLGVARVSRNRSCSKFVIAVGPK